MAGQQEWLKAEIKRIWDAINKLDGQEVHDNVSPSAIPHSIEIPEIDYTRFEIDYSRFDIPEGKTIENPLFAEITQKLEILDAAVLNNKETVADKLNLERELNEKINKMNDIILLYEKQFNEHEELIKTQSDRINELKKIFDDLTE